MKVTMLITKFMLMWCHVLVVINTAQLSSIKSELRFCAGSNSAPGVSEIGNGENLWKLAPNGNKAKCLFFICSHSAKTIHLHRHHRHQHHHHYHHQWLLCCSSDFLYRSVAYEKIIKCSSCEIMSLITNCKLNLQVK